MRLLCVVDVEIPTVYWRLEKFSRVWLVWCHVRNIRDNTSFTACIA